MKNVLVLLLCFISFTACAQNADDLDLSKLKLISMDNATVQYGTEYGQQYFVKGSDKPYTGFLCAYYDNGELEAVQQFEDGVGNGVWINFDPDGRKESQGTYVNNKTEGPATLFYEDGSIKATGVYIHRKRCVGWWKFYDRKGNVVSKRYFTR